MEIVLKSRRSQMLSMGSNNLYLTYWHLIYNNSLGSHEYQLCNLLAKYLRLRTFLSPRNELWIVISIGSQNLSATKSSLLQSCSTCSLLRNTRDISHWTLEKNKDAEKIIKLLCFLSQGVYGWKLMIVEYKYYSTGFSKSPQCTPMSFSFELNVN